MRVYLVSFFKDFDYSENDVGYLLSIYDKIKENRESLQLWESVLSDYEKDYLSDKVEFIKVADDVAKNIGVNDYSAELLLFICLSKHLKDLYVQRGINPEYFHKSMLDLKYKLEECKLVFGIIGTFVSSWMVRFFELKLFGIGRLQFEICEFGDNYEKDGIILTKESKVINVHIPRSGEKLTMESCMDSYLLAKDFFKDEINTDPCPFMCDSWLLYPEHETILSKESNIYKFYKSFSIISFNEDKTRSDLWRLFDTMEKNPEKLPTDTSIRRAYVRHLKNGGNIGTGKGILFV